MRILITNNTLADRAGTELYVRDLAIGLAKRGHLAVAYSTKLGNVAAELRKNDVTVLDDLEKFPGAPDIIHGHHHLGTMTALMKFSDIPAVYVCHGSEPWEESPPVFPRIRRYIAVDNACRERVLNQSIPEDRVRVLLNFVDLDRFKPRPSLPQSPRLALVFSNQICEPVHLDPIRAACNRAGIQLDVAGRNAGNPSERPEFLLAHYDIVFAKARAALEAMAVGTAVITCDAAGVGPMVSMRNVESLRPLNFGIKCLQKPISANVIAAELARYDPEDAARVSDFIRNDAGCDRVFDQFVDLYQEVIKEHREASAPDQIADGSALASYLRQLAERFHSLELDRSELKSLQRSRSWRLFSKYAQIKDSLALPIIGKTKSAVSPEGALQIEPDPPEASKI